MTFSRFMKLVSTVILGGSLLVSPLSQVVQAEESSRSGHVVNEFDLSDHEGKQVRLWIPYAKSDDYQTISNVEVEFDESQATSEINTDEHGNEILYIEFAEDAKERKVTYSFDVERKEVQRPELVEEGEVDAEEFAEFLAPNSMMPTDGEVEELAEEITAGKETVLDKAKAIYDWIYDNMERNNDVVGCGLGDVKQLLVDLDGKCTDIHSVFIALARSVGIPAREVFGVRLAKEDQADETKGQHCWAEFYLPGTGWVAVDIADVLKLILNDELEKDSEEALALKDYYWGNLDPYRVGLSTGRDLVLVPEQEEGPLNNFGYPYAEVDGVGLDCYDPESFTYTYTFEALSSEDEADQASEEEEAAEEEAEETVEE